MLFECRNAVALSHCTIILLADQVREYFGETIAMYFAFLGYYTFFLTLPAVLGLVTHFFWNDELSVVLFCVFNLVWATIFLEAWKRKTAELAYRWGTINMEHIEEPRAAFYGELGTDPVTRRLQPQYPSSVRKLKFYCVSVPVMLLALLIAWYVMLVYFDMEDQVRPMYKGDTTLYGLCLSFLPTVVYTVIVLVLNAVYHPLAVALNRWGNKRFLLVINVAFLFFLSLLLARLMGQYCFVCWRLSSSSVTLPPGTWAVGRRRSGA